MAKTKSNIRKIQAEESRQKIIDAALSVFSEKGFANTTIKDFADAAGISMGLMYHYFPGKEKLLEATVEENSFLPQLREILKDTRGQTYRDILQNITLRFIKLLEQKNKIIKIFLQEGFSNTNIQKVWSNLANEGVSLLRDYISERITAGDFRAHNAEITARCLFSSVIMFHFTSNILKFSSISRTQFVEEMLDTLFRGIQNSGK
jgi:AcrR family transcriptional regulator